jgi:hypothetical protein
MRVTRSAVVVLLVVIVVGPVGCRRGEDRQIPTPETEAQESKGPDTQAVASPAAPDLRPGSSEGEEPGAAAADVIRTRIAWRRHTEEGVPWPTPTPPPPVPVSSAGGAVWASEIGLMWTEFAAGMFEFQDAVEYCRELSTAGFGDWTMPSVTELELLLATDFRPSWIGDVPVLWSSTAHDIRGVIAVVLPEVARAQRAVGMAHVLCVRRIQ